MRRRPARTKSATLLAAVGAAAALLLSGCSNDAKGTGDAPVEGRRGDDTPAKVYNMPDGFGNLATKCVQDGYRAYVTTNSGGPSNIEIIEDADCRK
jgi:predicted small secreted protein